MDNNLQELLTELIKAIIGVIIPTLAFFAAQAIRRYRDQLQQQIGGQRWSQFIGIVEAAVRAAEQNGLKNELENTATAKKAWAISEVQRVLNERSLSGISVETISLAIESAIREGIHRRYDDLEVKG